MPSRRPRHPRSRQKDTLLFMVIAIGLMVLADQVFLKGPPAYHEQIKARYEQAHPPQPVIQAEPAVPEIKPPVVAKIPPTPIPLPPPSAPPPPMKARIAIIIDDMGISPAYSRRVMEFLPPEITLAFLPYAPQTPDLARMATAKGHELMIHVPMAAMKEDQDLGDMALRRGMTPPEITAELERMMTVFSGYQGINNHMGSYLTQDKDAMSAVMSVLESKNLFFVDSKTSPQSVAEEIARQAGVRYAARDIFIDHEPTAEFVATSLHKAEKMALKRRQAVIIGHPKDVTIEGLKKWIPTLKDKGIEIVPVSHLMPQTP
ncbi:MAG: divergent polysaccharide deacetylase family protein [Alphaproteobacteria bacterium]|nr:divergent polysaccharide deacetylase family protein [Alphaproteobacteria bacterium]